MFIIKGTCLRASVKCKVQILERKQPDLVDQIFLMQGKKFMQTNMLYRLAIFRKIDTSNNLSLRLGN